VGSLRSVLLALQERIATEATRPAVDAGASGTPFEVEVLLGHENLSKLPGARGRVVLALHEDGEDAISSGKVLNGTLRALCTWQPTFAASLWVPVGEAGGRQYLDRLDAIEALTKCVVRSLHEEFHGANAADAPIADSATVSRSPRHLRHGEAAVVLFTVGIPIVKGRPLTTLPPGTGLAVNLRVNPET